MGSTERVGDLELGQDLPFQRREWAVQRIAWAAMAAVLTAALLGLFGSGPVSDAVVETDELRGWSTPGSSGGRRRARSASGSRRAPPQEGRPSFG